MRNHRLGTCRGARNRILSFQEAPKIILMRETIFASLKGATRDTDFGVRFRAKVHAWRTNRPREGPI